MLSFHPEPGQGKGEACYGTGTNIELEHGNRYDSPPPNNTCMGVQMTDTSNPCCYDPVNLGKGAHAYPYVDYVWAYDAADFARVKNAGRIVDDPSPNLVDSADPNSTQAYKPWDIKPYTTWEINYPTLQTGYNIASGASAYDEVSKKLYLIQAGTEQYTLPIVHVFQLNIEFNSVDSVAPAAPSGLSIQ